MFLYAFAGACGGCRSLRRLDDVYHKISLYAPATVEQGSARGGALRCAICANPPLSLRASDERGLFCVDRHTEALNLLFGLLSTENRSKNIKDLLSRLASWWC